MALTPDLQRLRDLIVGMDVKDLETEGALLAVVQREFPGKSVAELNDMVTQIHAKYENVEFTPDEQRLCNLIHVIYAEGVELTAPAIFARTQREFPGISTTEVDAMLKEIVRKEQTKEDNAEKARQQELAKRDEMQRQAKQRKEIRKMVDVLVQDKDALERNMDVLEPLLSLLKR